MLARGHSFREENRLNWTLFLELNPDLKNFHEHEESRARVYALFFMALVTNANYKAHKTMNNDFWDLFFHVSLNPMFENMHDLAYA